jgi:site-specific recombinase XerD
VSDEVSKVRNQNMLRERAEKLPDITEAMFNGILQEHKLLVEEFLEMNMSLSKQTLKQYESAIKQFFYWVHTVINDKHITEITKRDFMRYRNYLQSRGMSSSGISFKKSVVSSFNNYIENIVADDDPKYKNFRNFTRGLPSIPKNTVYNKVKITKDEYNEMINVLLSDKNYLAVAWVATAFNVGARRAEIPQLKAEIISYDMAKGQNYILSHIVRGKGKSDDGKPLQYMINAEALKYIKLWIEKREYESEYIFTTKYKGKIKPMSEAWADNLCNNVLSDILGRRINPHLFKSSCITYLLEQGIDIALVSKFVAQHEDVSTTIKHYDLRDFEEEKNNIFK